MSVGTGFGPLDPYNQGQPGQQAPAFNPAQTTQLSGGAGALSGGPATTPNTAFGGGELLQPGDTNTYWTNPGAALHHAMAGAGMPTNTQNSWYQFLQERLPGGLSVLFDLMGGEAGAGFSGFMGDYLGGPASRSDIGSLMGNITGGGGGLDPLALAEINQTTDPRQVIQYLEPLLQALGTTGLNRMSLRGLGNMMGQAEADYNEGFNYGGMTTPFLKFLQDTGIFGLI